MRKKARNQKRQNNRTDNGFDLVPERTLRDFGSNQVGSHLQEIDDALQGGGFHIFSKDNLIVDSLSLMIRKRNGIRFI